MRAFITNLLVIGAYVACYEASSVSPHLLLVDRLRYDFFELQKELWSFTDENALNDNLVQRETDAPEVELIARYQAFGDLIQKNFDHDFTYGLDSLNNVWALQLAYADLRAVFALYESFRRFQRQQTAPGRIPSPKQAWLDLADTVLFDSANNVEAALVRIHGSLERNLFQSAGKEVEGDMRCNTKQSPQQVLYNLYNAIALTGLKGYTMIQFSYMVLRLHGKGNFSEEVRYSESRYAERTTEALEKINNVLKTTRRDYWNCDPRKHVKGDTYVEITNLLQGYVQNEVDLNPEGTCRENCAEYTYTKSHGCYQNLYCRQQRSCSGKIINCQFFDSDMWICNANPLSQRRYEYIEFENGRVLGRKQGCNYGTTKVDSWWRWLFWHCSYCFCLCDEQGPMSDRYINMRSVISDIDNNMVVTGLRFVKKNRIIHLQIQEGQLLPRLQVNASTIKWKPVEDYKITDRKVFNGQDYHTLTWEKRAMDLDDLEADDGYVVTGVRFKEIGSHLNFEIYTTKFDFDTGKLKPDHCSWKDNPNTDAAPRKPRSKLHLSRPDIPMRSPNPSIPTSKSDQYVEFVNTDIDRDAAQTTVPFFDAQKLEQLNPVPLSGAGVFHKGRPNFGGFITPKIITFDVSKYLKAVFPRVKHKVIEVK
ncbi:hypothetical protein GWI33_017355 [Rhynchophorus ferrugineus]|uniref:Uncharacterized protein n=1 Tax=Rhynchophorus ferrugineus TaxID=354439 RepID=A0A834I9E8_RHYFE|nr:hypothetical protein GWI33_017355 [Rhynchophorus ferrugineus]